VLALLEILQSGGVHTITEFAERLGVDRRTVRRYVEHLRELDVPVDSVRGRYGGYKLARHYRMPPLMLTDEEALAVIWALLATGWSGSGPVSPSAVQNATAKVRRVLPAALGRRIDAVMQAVDFAGNKTGTGSPSAPAHDGAAKVLLDVAEAARDLRPVVFDYTSRHGRESRREVFPHGVVAHRGLLYLAGHDVGKNAPRTFRLDRIRQLRLTDGSFAAPEAHTALEQVLGPLPPDPSRQEVSVLVKSDAEHVRHFIPELLASVEPAADTDREADWVRVFVRAERLEWVAQRLAAIDRPFVVERPAELTDVIRGLAQRLLAYSDRPHLPDNPDSTAKAAKRRRR
jgi:predicted DNA-binding transcriptional regulator YafY